MSVVRWWLWPIFLITFFHGLHGDPGTTKAQSISTSSPLITSSTGTNSTSIPAEVISSKPDDDSDASLITTFTWMIFVYFLVILCAPVFNCLLVLLIRVYYQCFRRRGVGVVDRRLPLEQIHLLTTDDPYDPSFSGGSDMEQ